MYRWLVERKVRQVFSHLSRGDYEAVLPGLAQDVHHRFAGNGPLGGERDDRQAVRLWFQRLYRLFPSLRFTVHDVSVAGAPWDLTVSVEWTAAATPRSGPMYSNIGCHVLRIKGGKVTSLHAYEDSQAVAAACSVMVAAGIEEAAAPPITRAR